MIWPFGDLEPRAYQVILADPPWRFDARSADPGDRSPEQHYLCADTRAIAALPVARLAAAAGAMLVMWTTGPMLARGDAHAVMRGWGFDPKTAGAWAKLSRTGEKIAMGTGYLYRSAAEFWLIGARGAGVLPRDSTAARSVRNLIAPDEITRLVEWAIAAPVREHSRKPDAMYEALEALFDGPYCELFARTRRPGWASWGNQVDRFHAAS